MSLRSVYVNGVVASVALAALAIAVLGGPAQSEAGQSVKCFGKKATIVGTSADDRIKGTPGRDVIVGAEGDDFIRGRERQPELAHQIAGAGVPMRLKRDDHARRPRGASRRVSGAIDAQTSRRRPARSPTSLVASPAK